MQIQMKKEIINSLCEQEKTYTGICFKIAHMHHFSNKSLENKVQFKWPKWQLFIHRKQLTFQVTFDRIKDSGYIIYITNIHPQKTILNPPLSLDKVELKMVDTEI